MKNFIMLLITGVASAWSAETVVEDSMVVIDYLRDSSSLSSDKGYRYISMDERKGERTLSELLTTIPGVSSTPSRGVGSYETVSIRGVDGSRVAVYLDGIPLQSAMGGSVDLSRIPMESLEGVEVYKGITPAELGGNSLGGAIHLKSKTGKSSASREITQMLGSFSEYRGTGSIIQPVGNGTFLGLLDYHSGENDYPYLDRNATLYNPGDDVLRNLNNNRSVAFNSKFGISQQFNNGSKGSLYWAHREKKWGIPAAEGFENQTAYSQEREDRVIFNLSHPFNTVQLNHSCTVIRNWNKVFWTGFDTFGTVHNVLGKGDIGTLLSTTWFGEYRNGYSVLIGDYFQIKGTLFGSFEEMVPVSDVDGFGYAEWNSNRITGSNATDFTISPGNLSLVLGGSLTGHRSSTEGGYNPYTKKYLENETVNEIDYSARAGVSYHFLDENLSLFANGAIYTRTPSLRELFGYRGGVIPSLDLEKESGKTAELGSSFRSKNVSIELTGFINHYDNLIMTLFDGRVARATNIGENRSFGLEQTLFWQILPILSLRESITLQKTENLTQLYKGNLLPNQPPFSLYSDLTIRPIPQFSFSTQFGYDSKLYRDLANEMPYPFEDKQDLYPGEDKNGKVTLSLFSTFNWKWFELSGGVRDLLTTQKHTDSDITTETGDYLILYPGRVWHIELKCTF